MRLRQVAGNVSWPLWLTVALAALLLNKWYISGAYLTYGDFHLNGPAQVLPGAFHLWTFTSQFGGAEPANWWHRAFLGALFSFHVNDAFAERIVWLYFAPPLLIGGLYLLAKTLTGDIVASGLAALAGFFNVDFLVRLIGGHDTALIAIALGPWVVLSAFRSAQGGSMSWAAILTLSVAVASAYDARWALPSAALALVLALTVATKAREFRGGALCVAAVAAGLILPNLPWLFSLAVSSGAALPWSGAVGGSLWLDRLSLATAMDALVIWNPTFASAFSDGPVVIAHAPLWTLIFPLALCVSVALSRSRYAWIFFVSYLAAAFLFKGTQPPAGAAYAWLYDHIPLFGLYRESLKFGALASLSASIVLAYGVSAIHNRIPKNSAAAALSLLLLATAWPAFSKAGTLIPRAPGSQYGWFASILSRDPAYSRVLWLPEPPRWFFGSLLHPLVAANLAGTQEWLPFRYDKRADADPLQYVYSPLFPRLLQWHSFRYVVVDCDTEQDATFRSESFSCAQILQSLAKRRELSALGTAGPLHVFRLTGSTAPGLWSAKSAALALGRSTAWNAGAAVAAFRNLQPLAENTPLSKATAFDRFIVFDGAQIAHSPRSSERIAGADSIDLGPNAGDAIIDGQPFPHALGPGPVFRSPATIAYSGTAAHSGPLPPQTLNTLPHANWLVPPGFNLADLKTLRPFGWETPRISIPIYEKPAVRISALQGLVGDKFLLHFDLWDPKTNLTYRLIGPSFSGNTIPGAEFDVRDYLFRTIIANARYDKSIGRNDQFDGMRLTRVRLQAPLLSQNVFRSVSLLIRATAPQSGLAVGSAVTFLARHFTCDCTEKQDPSRSNFLFTGMGRRDKGWMERIVVIDAASGPIAGVISSISGGVVTGLATAGTPFRFTRSQIKAIRPAPDQTTLDLGVSGAASGVLLLRGTKGSAESVELLLKIAAPNGFFWAKVSPIVPEEATQFVSRVDLFAAAGRFRYSKILDAVLLVKRRFPGDRTPIRLHVGDAVLVNDRGWEKPRTPPLVFRGGSVSTALSAGNVPVAVGSSIVAADGSTLQRHDVEFSVRTPFEDRSGNRWLVFSQRFDPGWKLVGADGSTVDAQHVASYGTLNAWFVPEGLHGRYWIVYAPDRAARAGAIVAIIAALACLVAAVRHVLLWVL